MGGERHAAVACGCAARGVSGVGREFQSDAGCSARLCSDARWEECVAVQLLGGEGVKQGTGNGEQGTGNRNGPLEGGSLYPKANPPTVSAKLYEACFGPI